MIERAVIVMMRLDPLYARYLDGHALGREGRSRPVPGADATLEEWALELGYVDGLAAVPLRAEADFALWCLCCRAYLRGATGADDEAPDDVGEAVDGGTAASTTELCDLLGSRDARSGQRRSPLALAALLRSLSR